MPAPFRPLTRDGFIAELMTFAWTRRIWRVDMHHTFHPAHADYDGEPCIARMSKFHKETRKWDDIASMYRSHPTAQSGPGVIGTRRPPASAACSTRARSCSRRSAISMPDMTGWRTSR